MRKLIKYIPIYALIVFVDISDVISVIRSSYTLMTILLVIGAILIDLVVGVQKARRSGVFDGTFGIYRTVEKVIRNVSLVLLGSIMDVLLEPAGISAPWATMTAGLVLVGLEVWSWFEKAETKDQKRIRTMINIAKNNKEAAKELLTALKKFEEDGDKTGED